MSGEVELAEGRTEDARLAGVAAKRVSAREGGLDRLVEHDQLVIRAAADPPGVGPAGTAGLLIEKARNRILEGVGGDRGDLRRGDRREAEGCDYEGKGTMHEIEEERSGLLGAGTRPTCLDHLTPKSASHARIAPFHRVRQKAMARLWRSAAPMAQIGSLPRGEC